MSNARHSVAIIASIGSSIVNFRAPLVQELVRRKYRVIAVAPGFTAEQGVSIAQLGAEVFPVQFARTGMNPLKDILGVYSLYRFFRSKQPGGMLAYTAKPVVYGLIASKLAGIPTRVAMITGLGYSFTEGEEWRRKIARMAAGFLYRLSLGAATSIIFQNPDDEALFRKLGLLPKGTPVHQVNGSGVDCAHFNVAPLPETPVFLMVSRLLKDKGVREYAEAAKQVLSQFPTAQILLAGWIDQSPNAVSEAELLQWQKDGIQFLGKIDNVRAVVATANVVVLPSYREGTPRSVLEGMAMGRAIITSDAPGCRETVEQGVNGLLVPPRNSQALADAMIALAQDPKRRMRMGAQSRNLALKKYEAHAVARDTLLKAGLVSDIQ